MKKRWKSLIAWVLIITIIGGYGNTALAAGLGDGISSGTGNGTGPKAGISADAGTGSQGEVGENSSSGEENKETGGSTGETGGAGETGTENGSTGGTGTETGGTGDTGSTGETGGTGETGTEDGDAGYEGEEVSQEPADTVEAEEPLETEEMLDPVSVTAQAGTYAPYWEDGNYSNLVVLVDFADSTHDHTDQVEELRECFKTDPADTFKYFNGDEENPRGMRQYLYNISYGQLRVENIFPQYNQVENTITPYTLSCDASYYVNNESAMVTEIIEQLKASGQLQNNMNLNLSDPTYHIVDNLNIVVADDGSDLFIDHKATYAGNEPVAGCLVRDYTVVTESDIYGGYSESGVIIHELLHSLGYPDTYRQGSNSGIPIGSWDIMSTVNHRVQYPLAYLRSAYTKWFEIPSVTESQTGLSLYAASKTTADTKDQQALILKTDYSDTEFFVVEYRKQGKKYSNEYEEAIPGSGLIVYRVNTSQKTNYVGTTDLLYLFRPGDSYGDDGTELGAGNYNEAHLSQEVGRTSYGSSNFDDSLAEGAITYSDGKNSGIVISNVGSAAGDQITFDVTFHEEEEGVRWKTVATEKEGEVTSKAASCMDEDGNFYFILEKGGTSYLYQCKDGAFTRLGTVPSGSSYKLAWYNGQLYTGYMNSQFYAKLARWNGSSWQELYTTPRKTYDFSMTSDSKGVYLAYTSTDGTRVYAAGYTAAGVAELGGQVASSTGGAANASIAAENGTIVVMYREASNKNRIYVKQYNSSTKSWSNVGSQSFSANSGLVKIRSSRVYLMKNGTTFGENKSYLYVYDLKNGGSWQQVGSGFYADASIAEMDLCFVGRNPYVVYMSGSQPYVTEVKRLQDGAWTNLGESVSREIVSGLNVYAFDGQIYVTYLNAVNSRVSVKSHASESTGEEEFLWGLFPDALDYGTIEAENPFWQLIERSKNGTVDSGIAAFSEKRYTDSFGSQIEDPLAKEIYDIMVERYAKGRLIGDQEATLTHLISFTASVSGGSIVPDDNYEAARQRLTSCFNLAFGAFYMDYPSVFWMNRMGLSYGIWYDDATQKAYITKIVLRPGTEYYDGASGQVASYDAAVKAVKDAIEAEMVESGLDPEDRYQQVKAIHEYLCDKLTYDHEAGSNLGGENYGYAHTSSTVFLGYKGEYKVVCEGYAKAFKVLCEQWDIPCTLVIGQGGTPGDQGPHMWNYVQMEDGLWYGMDATWDDQELVTGAREEYFLAGSNTIGFRYNDGTQYKFIEEHVPDMQITTGAPYPFVYPELEQERYEPGYRGRIHVDENGKWLEISEVEAEKKLSSTEILSVLQKNRRFVPFDGISIVRTDSVEEKSVQLTKQLEKELINGAISMLKVDGELEFVFREETTRRRTEWHLVYPQSVDADRNFDGRITATKASNGAWSLTLSDSDFPAEQVWVSYSDPLLGNYYNSPETAEETRDVYYYRMVEREKTFVSVGAYVHTAAGEDGTGELHTLALYDINDLETGVSYTAETSRYDWRLEYGFQAESVGAGEADSEGTVVYYTSQEELIGALGGMSLAKATNIRIYSVGKEQPEEIPASLFQVCAEKGLNLEYTRREKRGLSYTWNLQGLSIPEGKEAEDFDLTVDLKLEDAELPPEFMERTYIQVAPKGTLPRCERAELRMIQEGISSRFADGETLNLWLYKGERLRYLRPAQRDQEAGNWVSFELNQSSEEQIYVLTSQSEYGWQTKEENGKTLVYYIENRTGRPVTGWQIVEGRKCYFTEEGYLCEGLTWVETEKAWYLFGDYQSRTQGILTGYQEYPKQKPSKETEAVFGTFYYANADGVVQKGWQKIDNIWHYFNADAGSSGYAYGQELPSKQEGYWVVMEKGSGSMEGRRYYFRNNTTLLKNWQTIDGRRYFFMPEGYALTGWYPNSTDKNVYYLNELGQMETGYVKMEADSSLESEEEDETPEAYFFHTNGLRQYGWQRVLNEEGVYIWHYFNADPASTSYGQEIPSENTKGFWYVMEGDTYYFINNARLAAGWQTIEGKRYYFDGTGKMYTGTKKIGSAFYHFRTEEDQKGVLGTGLFEDDGKTYYANTSGVLLRGWQKIDGNWRFFNHETGEEKKGEVAVNYWAVVYGEDGAVTQISYFINGTRIATGWQTIEGRRYYFDGDGILRTGFFKIGNNTYYGREETDLSKYPGEVLTGEQRIGDAEYYFGSNYVMYVGWQKVDGAWCFFSMEDDSPARGRRQESLEPTVEASWYWYTVNGEKYCFRNNTSLLRGWQTINGQRYYLDPVTGAATVGTTLKIGSYTYCFDSNGVMLKNTIKDGYGYNASGYRVSGWQKINNEWHYFAVSDAKNPDTWKEVDSIRDGYWVTLTYSEDQMETYYFRNNASLVKGWQIIDGKRYYFDPKTGVLQTGNEEGLYTIGANTYYLGEDGVLRYGWIRERGEKGPVYYANTAGVLLAGWQKIDNLWYYFDRGTRQQDQEAAVGRDYFATAHEDGKLQTFYFVNGTTPAKGWQTIGGLRYYFDPVTNVMQTGFFQVGKAWYYFYEDRTPGTGWMVLNGHTYYFNNSGQAVTGWQNINGSRYYFDANGIMQTQRTKIGNNYYFFGPDGKMRTGFVKYCDTTYYFNGSGVMLKGWQTISGQRYYFDAEGSMQTGFLKIGTATYYFGEARGNLGQLLKGEQNIGEHTYYFNNSGVLQYGWQKLNNEWRYFDPKDGAELETETDVTYWVTIHMPDGGTERSFINNRTTVLKGWQTIAGKRYYFDANGLLWTEAKGWLVIGNNRYYFNAKENDSVYQGFLELAGEGENKQIYYLNANGQMLKGWQTIKIDNVNGRYYLDPIAGTAWMGHQKIGNYWYYFDATDNGRMATGYIKDSDGIGYYYNTSGLRQYGWQKIENVWHFFMPQSGEECKVTVDENYWAEIELADGTIERAFIRNGSAILKGWQIINGQRYYFDGNGFQWREDKGWLIIGSNRFYFDANKNDSVYQGFLELQEEGKEKETYYLNANGQALKGWQTIKVGNVSGRYYLDPATGAAWMGHQKIGNYWYYFEPSDYGKMATGYVTDSEGDSYYYNTNGTLITGWQKLKGEENYRYFDAAGDGNGRFVGVERTLLKKEEDIQTVVSGRNTYTYHWYTINDSDCTVNGSKYCFLNNNTLLRNRQTIDGKYYWFHSSTGALYTGYFAIGQNRYYSNADGTVYTGFDPCVEGDSTAPNPSAVNVSYYNVYGQRVTGWQNLKDKEGISARYYFNANGIMLKGICWIGNVRYVFHPENGKMITGGEPVEIDGKTYYANTNGTLKTGWSRFYENGEYIWRCLSSVTGEYLATEVDTSMPETNRYVWYHVTEGEEAGIYCVYNNGSILKNYQNIGGKRYYFNAVSGKLQMGWFLAGANKCYSDSNTAEITGGFHDIDGATYYLNTNGLPLKSWQRIYNSTTRVYSYYYFDADGRMLTGFQTIGSARYYLNEPNNGGVEEAEEGARVTGNVVIRDKDNKENEYYFNGNGVMQYGWFRFYDNEERIYTWKYFGIDGIRVEPSEEAFESPKKEENALYHWYCIFEPGKEGEDTENWYCIYNNAAVLKNFYNIGTWRYYFDTKAGILQKGHFAVGTVQYYSDPATGGINRSGCKLWENDKQNLSYFDGNGRRVTGWLNLKEQEGDGTVTNRYYFDPSNQGQAAAGFTKIGSQYYYFDPDTRVLQRDAADLIRAEDPERGEVLYYTGRYEYLLSGWQKVQGVWYYFDPVTKEGTEAPAMTEGDGNWVTLGGNRYYFRNGTTLVKGWQTIKDENGVSGRYYFDTTGALKTGWIEIGANRYYTDPETGKAVTGFKTFVNGVCENGVRAGNDYNSYYFDNNGLMRKGWISETKKDPVTNVSVTKSYYFNANGIMLKGICWIGNIRYVLHPDTGEKVIDSVMIGGITYYANPNGTLKTGWQKVYNKEKRIYESFYYGTDGRLCTGWQEINKQYYYFDENGVMLTGYHTDLPVQGAEEETASYYFNGNGIRQGGWFRFTENKVYVWRYFDAEGQECPIQAEQNESPKNETIRNYRWYQTDGNWYCIYNNASVLKGFYNLGTWRYYFDSATGALKKGNFAVGSVSYYSDPDTGAICRSGYKLWTQKYEEKKLVYFDGNGRRVSGWLNLKEGTATNRYYFNPSNGEAASGFTKVGNQYYYFDPQTKVLQRNASAVIHGLNRKEQEVLYYTGRYEYLLSGWQKIDGSWYYFDAVTKEGERAEIIPERDSYWVTLENGTQYYFLRGTTLAKGWQNIVINGEKGRYYFDNNGVLQKGWIAIGANRYYTDAETGRAVSGLKTFVGDVCEDGVRSGNTYNSYYFDGNGLMRIGQVPVNTVEDGKTVSRIYYFNADGIMMKGIFWIGNTQYVHHPDSGERVFTSVAIDGKTYYANTNGTLKTGLQRVYNNTKRVYESFYYGTDGQMHTGWQEINGQRYYFDPADGVMKTGYQRELPIFGTASDENTETDDNESMETAGYYFNTNGVMQTGWILSSEKDEAGKAVSVWRYFSTDGREMEYTRLGDLTPMGEKNAAYVWYEVEEPVEDADASDEENRTLKHIFCIYNNRTVLKNFYNLGSSNKYRYYFDAKTGELQKGEFVVGTAKYYSDPEMGAIERTGLFLTAVDGELYYYDGNGKQVTGWLTIRSGEHAGKYYFHTLTGAAYRGGWYYIDNVRYLFDLEGKVREVPVISTVVTNNYKTALITWKEVAGAKRYVLEYATDAAFTNPQILSIEDSSIISKEIQGLQEGMRYYFRLKYELESKQTGEVEESVYSAVKNVVIQSEVTPTGTSAVFEKFVLAEVSAGEAEDVSGETEKGTVTGIRAEFTVKGRLKSYNGDGNYYLVRVDSYSNRVLSEPLHTISKDTGVQEGDKFRFTFELPLPEEFENDTDMQWQGIMSRYALAVKNSAGGYMAVSRGTYVSNPEFVAEYQTPYFQAASKKGIQGATELVSRDAGTKQTLLNLDLKNVLKSGPGGGVVTYEYKGKTYYFSDLSAQRGTVTEYNNGKYGNKISVTMAIMTSYRSDYRRELVHPSARRGSSSPYYTLNSSTQSGQELYEAMFSYLGEIFGQDDCYVSNWVLGNEVNSCNAWNYTGSLSFGEYMKCYAASFRQLYYGVKKTRASSKVFISLDNAWNRAVAGYTGKSVLDTFASYIQAEGADIEWNVAFHPYSAPLTRTDFWNDYSNTSNSTASPFISMRNLNYLTSYLGTMETRYGKSSGSIRVILSEQGWTSSRYGENTQATAIAWAYYIAEFNPRVDAFIIRAEIDDWEEMRAGLYMGLKNYAVDTKKTSYYVYKYMDTPRVSQKDETTGKLVSKQTTAISDYTRDCLDVNDENKPKFMDARTILCGTDWSKRVGGYDVGKLNQMPYAAIPDLKKLPD